MSLSLKDKKLLAEWIGMEFLPGNSYRAWEEFDKNWKPDTNHRQFKEVWSNLTIDQTNQILSNLVVIDPGYMAHLILNDLPRVCKAVIEVIK